jgi:hypothetical protein
MLKVIHTLDYEIHGNGDGCPDELMVQPTRRMLDQFDQYGAKLTIMADVAEILKFREFAETRGEDKFHFQKIADQLRDAVRRGHDVQLHIHSSYLKARFDGVRWAQDWSEYNFAGLPYERMNEVIRLGKEFLETLLRPVKPDYECVAFRAANWSVMPSKNVVRALVANNIRIDTSVFKYGRREGIVSFDYCAAHSDLVPWRINENDINKSADEGKLIEFPIYCERRWIGAFVTFNRFHRVLVGRTHRIVEDGAPGYTPASIKQPKVRGILAGVSTLKSRHAWKADFNQCTGWQLVRALERASLRYGHAPNSLPFVLIGHSKLFTEHNESSLKPFLQHTLSNPGRFAFSTLASADYSWL